MKTIRSLFLALAFALAVVSPAGAAFPWSTSDPLEVAGATPTCTYTATAFACIENMTANVTSVTLAGMTAGNFYTIIFVQDATGSRTLTQASITQATGGPAVPAIPATIANWTVWIIKATSASAATFVSNVDNAPLWDTFVASDALNTVTATTILSTAAAPTLVFPGMTATHTCTCQPTTVTVAGIPMGCLAGTNLVTCEFVNAGAGSPSEASITAIVRGQP